MGKFEKITSSEGQKDVAKARALQKEGKSVDAIAAEMGLSQSRIKELLKGVNWNSKA